MLGEADMKELFPTNMLDGADTKKVDGTGIE